LAARGPQGIDGVTRYLGFRWEHYNELRLTIEERHINLAGLLSGAVTYAMVDYCMGSTLWKETAEDEGIATVSISINYVQTATEGDIVCTTELDRRNRRLATMRSEVRHEDGRLIATAIGSYTIYPRKKAGVG
jgi:uncharacterized protein (TIGR00369 family)